MYRKTKKKPMANGFSIILIVIFLMITFTMLPLIWKFKTQLSSLVASETRELEKQIVSFLETKTSESTSLLLGRNTYTLNPKLKAVNYEQLDLIDSLDFSDTTIECNFSNITSKIPDFYNYATVKNNYIVNYSIDNRTNFIGFHIDNTQPMTSNYSLFGFDTKLIPNSTNSITWYPQFNSRLGLSSKNSDTNLILRTNPNNTYAIISPKLHTPVISSDKAYFSIPTNNIDTVYIFRTNIINCIPINVNDDASILENDLQRLPYIKIVKLLDTDGFTGLEVVKYKIETNYSSFTQSSNVAKAQPFKLDFTLQDNTLTDILFTNGTLATYPTVKTAWFNQTGTSDLSFPVSKQLNTMEFQNNKPLSLSLSYSTVRMK